MAGRSRHRGVRRHREEHLAGRGRRCGDGADRSSVLRCGPGEHESRLSFAALRDLLEDAYDETAAKLPAPQRRALAVALLREEPEAPLDRGAVSAAFLTFLRERSRTGQCCVVVDDVQWLDRPTASALAFAIRRLRDEPVGLVLALRSDGGGQVALGLDRALAPDRLHRITLGPLSLGALQAMLRARLGRSWPRPLLRRIHENADGNPFFALEIARALERDWTSPGSTLPVPRDLEELLRARIDVLPASARSALLVVSASSQPTPDLVAAATGLGLAAHDALAAAERAGVIEIRAGQVGSRTRCWRRRSMRAPRRTNAGPSIEPSLIARRTLRSEPGTSRCLRPAPTHRSPRRSTTRRVWRGLEARRIRPRSSPTWPASSPRPPIAKASFAAASRPPGHLFDAGNAIRAQELFLEMAAATPPRTGTGGHPVAPGGRLVDGGRSRQGLSRGGPGRRVGRSPTGERDQDGARVDVDLRRRCRPGHHRGSSGPWRSPSDSTTRPRCPRRSRRSGSASSSPVAMAQTASRARWRSGRTGSFPDTYTSPRVTMGLRSLWAGELDAARSTLEAVLDHLAERGLYTLATEPHEYLGEIECRAGRYELAARHAANGDRDQARGGIRGAERARPLSPGTRRRAPWRRARRPASTRRRAGVVRTRRPPLRELQPGGARVPRAIAGALRRGREHLDPVVRFLREMGVREPCVIPVHADAIEARIGMGDSTARPSCSGSSRTGSGDRAAMGARHGARDAAGCCSPRAAMAPAALRMFERALEEHRRVPQPLELARTLLAKGQVERRAKQRSPRGRPFSRRSGSSRSSARRCGPPGLAPSSPGSAAERRPATS